MIKVETKGQYEAVIVDKNSNNILLNDIDVNEIKKLLSEHGVLLFRNFEIDISQYSQFLQRMCRKITLDPARTFVSGTAQLVDSGFDEIPLHCENGLTPFLPDLLVFMCEIPALSGSATTYCDGKAVWKELSDEAKSYFSSHRFYFKRSIPKMLWEKYLRNEMMLEDSVSLTNDMISKVIAAFPQHRFEFQDNGDLIADLEIPLAHPSYFSSELVFANSLIGPSFNYQNPTARDEEGNPVSESFYNEFKTVSDRLTKDVLWQKHDMLVIDNTRFMHGRRKIEDKNRKIYAGMGYL